ncbi:MAG: hypothetical protein WCK92_09950 [Bacteroidota bacterium]
MIKSEKTIQFFFTRLLSEEIRKKSERVIITIAVISFIVHLLLVALVNFGVLQLNDYSHLFSNPISAIYTPFSFILIYEVYLLVYYLPKSTTIYIGKQYEIITLILIRGIFKDLANLQFTRDWFNVSYDLKFTYDLAATLILFFLIYVFYKLNERKSEEHQEKNILSDEILKFIRMKNIIAICLIPIFVILAVWGLFHWIHGSFFSISQIVTSLKDVNTIFFNEFFTVLILTDVLLLLLSFSHTDKFNKVIRNSGFIISTILIKLSFGSDGLLNTILIVAAVLFGVILLLIHNQYKKIILPDN